MRIRDELFDALDRLPRPVMLHDTCVMSANNGEDMIMTNDPTEIAIIHEYFSALPAEEKVS